MIRFLWISLCAIVLTAFDFSKASIPTDQIYSGGPPKDGIPALTNPEFVLADQVTYLDASDRVVGVTLEGRSRAYPIRILNWHELVNDKIGTRSILVSYCPLCGTAMVFDSEIGGKRTFFGVSGLLYNSDVLFYDKETESLWSQIGMQAVTGPETGTRLKLLSAKHTTWGDWKERHPETLVLSLNTGYDRDYKRDPYHIYEKSQDLMFPVAHEDNRLQNKDWVAGILIHNKAKAYPFKNLPGGQFKFQDTFEGESLKILYDTVNQSVTIFDESGQELPSVQAYWFAWAAFYPDTEIYGMT